MFNFIKDMFGSRPSYRTRCDAVMKKYMSSDNPYDVKIAQIIFMSDNGVLNNDIVDKLLAQDPDNKAGLRESAVRFMREVENGA